MGRTSSARANEIASWAVVVACCGVAYACSEEPAAMQPDAATVQPDSGTPLDSRRTPLELDPPALPAEPAEPAAVAAPADGRCPDGWTLAELALGAMLCRPVATADVTCARGMRPRVGREGCTPIGTPCGADPWALDLPDGPTSYVRASAPPGGNGTRVAPFSSIADAVARAVPGTVIALSKGEFNENVVLTSDVTLWGACAADTTVRATSETSGPFGTITVQGPRVSVRNLRIAGPRVALWADTTTFGVGADVRAEGLDLDAGIGGIAATDIAHVTAHDVLVRGGVYGFEAVGLSTVELDDVVVDDAGFGVRVEGGIVTVVGSAIDAVIDGFVVEGGSLDVSSTVVAGFAERGFFAQGAGATLDLADVWIDGSSAGADGAGVVVLDGLHATATRLAVSRAGVGALAMGRRTNLDLEDVAILDAADTAIQGSAGAVLGGERLALARGGLGVVIADEGTVCTLSDLRSDERDERALGVQDRASLSVTRATLSRSRAAAMVAASNGVLTLTDVRATDTRDDGDENGSGAFVQEATLHAHRVVIEGSRTNGLFVDSGATVDAEDLVVRDTTQVVAGSQLGRGIMIQRLSSVTLVRALVDTSTTVAVSVAGTGTALTMEDVTLTATRPDAMAGFGSGLAVIGAASASGRRVRIADQRDLGVFADGAGATVNLEESLVESITGLGDGLGYGIAATEETQVTLERVVVRGASFAGILAAGGVISVHDVDVDGTMPDERSMGGRGVQAQLGGRIEGAGLFVRGSHGGAVIASSGDVVLTDVHVIDTHSPRCDSMGCDLAGVGLVVIDGTADLTRFTIEQAAQLGVWIFGVSSLDLHEGLIAGCPVGVGVQSPGYDVRRAQDRVTFEGVAQAVSNVSYTPPPPPAPVGALGE